jgi:two-component sensor histidine kinase
MVLQDSHLTAFTQFAEAMPAIESRLTFWRTRFRIMRRLGAFLSASVVLLAGAVLVFGWALNFDAMRRLHQGLPGMAVSTAIGLLGCAACIFSNTVLPRSRSSIYQTVIALFFLVSATINLGLLAVVPGRGLDQVLFGFTGEAASIYMSPATAICLALAAGSLLIPRRRGYILNGDLFGLFVATGLVITVLALTGYFFDSLAVQEVFLFSAMALHTAIGFFVVFLVLLLSRPTWGWMRVIVGQGAGSVMLRRTLPYVIIGPIAFCWLTLIAVDAGVFNANFRLSVLAIATASCLTILLFWNATRENADANIVQKSNRQLRSALADRDILLKEVYHRVKNNLQFIDAMLALEIHDGGNTALVERLSGIRARVHAMALVHQHLIGARDLTNLNLRDFVEELCANQANGAGFNARDIRVEARIVPILIDLDCAIPIGLIVTELLSNAAKHAFPSGRSGVISVVAEQIGNHSIQLSVGDDGVGRTRQIENSGQVGSMIVRSLAAQLGAKMDVVDGNGFRIDLIIPLKSIEKVD